MLSAPGDLEVRDIAYDSREVQPGTLFVAIPAVGQGPASGGFAFIHAAIQAGALAVVIPEGAPAMDVAQVRVPDTRSVLADLAAVFFAHPSRQLRLFAVTGTDGKTTTTYFLEQIFAAAGYRTGMIGTVETKVGEDRQVNIDRMTTPESLDIQRLLRRMVNAGVSHAAVEASSHALALGRLRACSFAGCAVTNITSDHIEFHGSWEEYFRIKSTLFTELAPERPAVLNRDDEQFDRLAALVPGTVLSYGLADNATLRAIDLQPSAQSTACTVVWSDRRAPMTVPMPGRFNVSNALAAAGLALSAGMPLHEVIDGITRAHPPPGRMERVSTDLDFDVVVDYAHTPNAFQQVLATLRERQKDSGHVIAVFGAAGNRDRAKRPLLASIARRYADYFFITNEDPCDERADAIIDEVASGVPGHEEGRFFERQPDRGRAITTALSRARPGDVVIILGKGHERSIVVDGRKEPWSDAAAVRHALEALR